MLSQVSGVTSTIVTFFNWLIEKPKTSKNHPYLEIIKKASIGRLHFNSLYLFGSISEYMLWEEEIEKWQNPILKDDQLPEW